MKKKFFLVYIYIGFISITAFILMLWITPFGSGVSADSTVYIGGAKNLLSGKGFFINGSPITHFPPLYSLFLAAASLFGNDIIQASRFLNAIIFCINAGLVALAAYLATERNYLASGCAVLSFLSSTLFLEIHSWAWSEPLFITFSLACIILLSMYTIRPTISLLIASSLFLGFALVTRYVGMAFLPAALVIVFISESGQHIGRRFRNILIWSIVACVPLGVSLARNTIMAGSATNRSLVFHPVSVYDYSRGFASGVTSFFVPTSFPDGVKLAILGFLVFSLIAMLVILFKHHRGAIDWRKIDIGMSASSLLFFFFYMLFLFISISFLDASTSINPRLLSPILVILNVGLFPIMWAISQTMKKPVIWWVFLLFMALSILIKIPDAIQSATAIQKNGLGYTAQQWQESESIAFVRSLANNVDIYSNGIDVLSFLTENQSLSIPCKTNSTTMIDNVHYDEEIEVMCKDIVENKALLVYFDQITWRWYLPSQAEIESTCDLPILQYFADGTVYGEK